MYNGIGINVETSNSEAAKQLFLCFGLTNVVEFNGDEWGTWLSGDEAMSTGTLYENQGFSHPLLIAPKNDCDELDLYCVAKKLFGDATLYSVYEDLGKRAEQVYAKRTCYELSFVNNEGVCDFEKYKEEIEQAALEDDITPSWTTDSFGCLEPEGDEFSDLAYYLVDELACDDSETCSKKKIESKKIEKDFILKLLDEAKQQAFDALQQLIVEKYKV